MKLALTKSLELELEDLIPTYGENCEEVIKFILSSWLTKDGLSATQRNNYVKELMIKNRKK